MKLGERLTAIKNMVPQGARIADIGSDHAYLPVSLVQSGQTAYAVAGDIHNGPFQSARETVTRARAADRISVRFGAGMTVLAPGEVDTVIIAGMGGATMIDILEESPEVVRLLSRLILQPMVAGSMLRRWLVANCWQIVTEDLVEEDGKLYEIIMAEPGHAAPVEPALLEIGPILWQTRHPLLKKHISLRLSVLKKIVVQMANSPHKEDNPRYTEYSSLISLLEEKYRCL